MDNLSQVAEIVEAETQRSEPVVVVSAFSGVTNKLLQAAETILEHPGNFLSSDDIVIAFVPFKADAMRRLEAELLHLDATERENILNQACGFLDARIFVLGVEIAASLKVAYIPDNGIPDWLQTYLIDRIIGIGESFSASILARVMTVRSQVGKVFKDVDLSCLFNISFSYSREKIFIPKKEILFRSISDSIRNQINGVFSSNETPVVGGYVGHILGGILNTVGRGYTDTTAALTAVALKRDRSVKGEVELQIWKEVPGLMSGDPKLVEPDYNPKQHRRAGDFHVAKIRGRASFIEAAELSGLAGMNAINPNVIFALDGADVKLTVRNTFDPADAGTEIAAEDDCVVKGVRFVSGKKGQTMYRVRSNKMINQHGVAARIFSACAKLDISVDAITTSATTVAFSIDGNSVNINELQEKLVKIGTVDRQDNMALICCIGNDMRNRKGLLAQLAGILGDNGVNIEFDCGDADSNVTFVVKEGDYETAIKALHRELFEKRP